MDSYDNRFLIHVYGDSLSLPRNKEKVAFYEIYPELIREECEKLHPDKKVHLFNMSRGSATVESVYSKFLRGSYFFGCRSNILIIQVGVCDCAPRPIPMWLRNGIGAMPKRLRYFMIARIHHNRASIQRAGIKWQVVTPTVFSSSYINLLNEAIKEFDHIYVVNIAPTNSKTEAQSPGFSSQIYLYNQLISNVVSSINSNKIFLVDVYNEINKRKDEIDSYINANDGHHLTVKSHQLYAKMIIENYKEKYKNN